MPKQEQHKTKYPGVYWIEGQAVGTARLERIYYIYYRKDGRLIEEKAGRQFQNDMTPARAATIRTERLQGKELSNKERREAIKAEKEAETSKWTIERLWEEYKTTRTRNKGLATDAGRYKKYLKADFGGKEPKELVPLDIDRVRLKLSKNKAPQTVKSVIELLSRIVNFGVTQNYCSPLHFKFKKPKVSNIKIEDLAPDQLKALLKAIDASQDVQAANLMRLVLYSGIRRGEAFNLKWEDIDFERGFIILKNPKGGRDERIPLNNGARAVLQSHPRTGSDFVFPGRGGKKRQDIHKLTRDIADKAGLPKSFRPLHGLRHYFATNLAASGQVDMYTLQRLLTHKDPRMTQRYAHLRDDALKRASNLAGQLIDQTITGKRPKHGPSPKLQEQQLRLALDNS